MSSKRTHYLILSTLVGLGLCLVLIIPGSMNGKANSQIEASQAPALGDYVVLAWNDLGMHCLNSDFADLAVLPPYNTLWAQVIRRDPQPQLVTTGITVTYFFADNTYSVGKTNFWDYDQGLFGVDLPANIGLTGKGLAGQMDLHGDHFLAEGIPLTEYSDSAPTVPQPFQLATVRVYDQASGALLAETTTVAPVSSEMRCDTCHADGQEASLPHGIATGKTETNILTLHDQENATDYPAGTGKLMDNRPVLCAQCHASNALGTAGAPGIPNLSKAMHAAHADEQDPENGCYACHPGPTTRCLRDVMATEHAMTCTDCHGSMTQVAQNPNPWLNEPSCSNAACHGSAARQDHPLYRFSSGHSRIYCSGCHDSPHAIAPSREARDGLKFTALQGAPGPLSDCTVCHRTAMNVGLFNHDGWSTLYLPFSRK